MNVAPPLSSTAPSASDLLGPSDTFPRRHIGPSPAEQQAMLASLGLDSLEQLIEQTIPAAIRLERPLNLPGASHLAGEYETLGRLRAMAGRNKVNKSFLGMGYYGTITPPVIQRNILENPGWYTQYTPYQAEISQGRLEALLNFQTMVCDLTALPLANASLLDEGTAAAEAMAMCHAIGSDEPGKDTFFISENCHPQTIAVVQARAKGQGIKTIVGDETLLFTDSLALPVIPKSLCGILVQYPGTDGRILDYSKLAELAHNEDILIVAATDLLALTLIKPPGEWGGGGADIAIGSAQRFGVPMGFGGPHAAFMATKSEYARKMPGRLVGVSKDVHGNPALRLALQTREQHIRREKATSNICTAQALLATMASMYAVYHGPEGLKAIASSVREMASSLAKYATRLGHVVADGPIFDTVHIELKNGLTAAVVCMNAERENMNIRRLDAHTIGISFDETNTWRDFGRIARILGSEAVESPGFYRSIADAARDGLSANIARTSPFLTHPVFNKYHSEHEMLRYIKRLESRDLSLTTSNIPLGSCTMKLNGTSEMIPVTWPEFADLHPFAPADQTKGYQELFGQLEAWLAEITGFAVCSLQPNAGSQGEYAGLSTIRAYHEAQARMRNAECGMRNICLIPSSAHGTNPASAVTAGFHVVPVACDENGNIDLADLRKKAGEHAKDLACVMVTYPSTHGVFEEGIKDLCRIVHEHGGQVYMDGANMNAQVGLTSPGFIGADVCHLNLHKTFCIPHGGGGPGVGPICVAKHLAAFLPTTDFARPESHIGPISAAPYGSASILPISWVYIALMGAEGLKQATQVAILNANYMAQRLTGHYPVLYKGKNGRVAHEFIVDCRGFEQTAGIKVEDIAKRLMDYGFHAPTMSWPVPGTLMFEPTESESKEELDRLCEAMILIREEIRALEEGRGDKADNALKHAPHTAHAIASEQWNHSYSRQHAAYPAPWSRPDSAGGGHKFWPYAGRIDNPYGDRNLVCTCPPVEASSA